MDPGFDDAVLGHSLPAPVAEALAEAALHRADAVRSGAALVRARLLAPDHPAVLIALYRDHFYAHRLAPARDIARRALWVGAQELGLPAVWREVPARALDGARTSFAVRFYLFALKGYAYLSLRLGDDDEARDALSVLRSLDPDDAVGGALLEQVRRRAASRRAAGAQDDTGDDADDDALPPVFGAAAWARLGAAA